MEKSRPIVILSAAMTLDGKIATRTGDSKLSSIKDKKRLHNLRAKNDAILVGKNTIKQDNPLLTVRYAKGKNPIRIIIDSHGCISQNSRIIKTSERTPTIIVVSKKISKKNLERLQKSHLEIIVSEKTKVNIKKLLRELYRKNIKSILLEGGGITNWEFIKNNLIDEAIITITPVLIGGTKAISLVQGDGFSKIINSPKLKLKRIIRQDNEVVLHYIKP